jgi:glycosyltransferase involved in cell wall biosynthesis
MRWPRIAVVIATYGKTDTLRLAVESALRQRYPDFRILIIVDGNPGQFAALRALYGGDDRIALHDLAGNSGEQSGPNNVGVALSDAAFVAFLNHDDLWFPDHLTILAEALLMRHADLAFSQAAGVFPHGRAPAAAEDCHFYLVSRLPGGRYRPYYSFVGVSNLLVRRKTFDALGGFRAARECWLESSQDFLIRALRAGARFAYADQFTSFALHSGIRAGSYLAGYDTQEHAVLATRLAEQDVSRVRGLVLRRLIPDDRWRLLDLFVRATGFPLRLAKPSLHGWRRGQMISRLRKTRGLSPLPRPATSVADFIGRRTAEHLTWITRDGTPEWRGRALIPLLGEGWHVPEDWGCWASMHAATLRFGIRARAGEQVELTFFCALAAGLVQRVAVDSGPTRFRRWYRLRRDAASPIEIVLRYPIAERDPVVTATLSTLVRYLPARHGFPDDGRRLGIAVGGLRLRFLPAPQHLDLADNPQ